MPKAQRKPKPREKVTGTMSLVDFGALVSTKRQYKGLTRKELAEKLDTSTSTIFLLENGSICPSLVIFDRIMRGLGIDLVSAREVVFHAKVERLRRQWLMTS